MLYSWRNAYSCSGRTYIAMNFFDLSWCLFCSMRMDGFLKMLLGSRLKAKWLINRQKRFLNTQICETQNESTIYYRKMMNMVNNYITLLIETTSKTYPQNGNFYIGYCCLTKQSFLKRLLLCQIFPITGTVLYDSFKYETCFYFF